MMPKRENKMCWLTDLFKKKTEFPVIEQAKGELPSPRIAIDPLKIDVDALCKALGIEGPTWFTTVANTNSMEPAIDADHYVLCSSTPKYLSEQTIKPGDVIIYQATWVTGFIIHSVISGGTDKDGWYCEAQGWHNDSPDPQKIRLSDIKWVVLLVVWTGKEDEL